MRTVLFTMSLAGTLALLCCVLFFRLFGTLLKAKWRRALLLLVLAFYLLPLPRYKFIILQGGNALHIIPDKWCISSGTKLQTNPYTIFIDSAGRSFYSDAQTILMVISGLLLTVSAVILLYQIVNYIRIRYAVRIRSQLMGTEEIALLEELKICMGIRRSIGLAQSGQVSVPVVSGVFSPTILLPRGTHTDDRALRSMLLHELAHIKHRDIPIQWVCLLAVALHWYNPFIYLLFHLLTEANEQYSDADAVHMLSGQEKRRYCEDLIYYSEQTSAGNSSRMVLGFSKNAKKQIRGRIDEVLNKKRKRPGIAICTGMFILMMGIGAAFIYQPPFTMTDTLPNNMDQEILFEHDTAIYFQPRDSGTDSKTSVFIPIPAEKED